MRICVTGGLGFIGSRVAALLLRSGNSISIIDTSRRAVRGVPDGLALHAVDIRDSAAVDRVLQGVDAVIHLAALQSVLRCEREPALVHDINVAGTRVIARSARRSGVGRLVFASSAAVYGDRPIAGRAGGRATALGVYGRSKLAAEEAIADECAGSDVETRALRLYNVYGPGQARQPPHAAVPAALSAARSGEPFTVRGSGEQVRDYIHVDDVADVIAAELHGGSRREPPLDVGTGTGTSIARLLSDVEHVTGRTLRRWCVPAGTGEIRWSVADVGPLRTRHPRFSPRSLRTGLAQTVEAEARLGAVSVGSSR